MFEDSADFSGIFETSQPMKVSKVLHKAFINVTENGCVAAAATCKTNPELYSILVSIIFLMFNPFLIISSRRYQFSYGQSTSNGKFYCRSPVPFPYNGCHENYYTFQWSICKSIGQLINFLIDHSSMAKKQSGLYKMRPIHFKHRNKNLE